MTTDVDIKLLEQALAHLEEKLSRDEQYYTHLELQLETRIQNLEAYITRLETRLTLGKGMFLGLSFAIGSALFTVWDKARDTVFKWLMQ